MEQKKGAMKVFMLHVGDPVEKDGCHPESYYLRMKCFNDGREYWYNKKDIVNATSQMESLHQIGIDIECAFLANRRAPIELFKVGMKLRKFVKQRNIEAVHVLWGSTSSLVTVLFSPVPVIVSFCGSDLMGGVDARGKRTFSGKISRFLSRMSALGAKKIITKSNQMMNVLSNGCRRKACVIPNGVDLNIFYSMGKESARAKLGWSLNDRIIIFFPGGDARVKDQPLAEKTVALVQQKLPDTKLVLLQGIPHEQLIYYYCAADVMILSSFHEGSNNSVKEAMACNLPIVSVNCGDTKERLVGVCFSYVIESRSPKDLADKVVEILNSGSRSNGRAFIKELGMLQIAHKVKSVYTAALSPRPSID